MLDVGRVCVKIAGREAGKVCCIVKMLDQNFVMVTGPPEVSRVKRRKCNILHLEPLQEKVNIQPDASDVDVLKAYQEAGLFAKLDLHQPSPEEARKHEEMKAEKGKAKQAREEKARKEREEVERKRQEAKKKEEAERKKAAEEKGQKPKADMKGQTSPPTDSQETGKKEKELPEGKGKQ